MNKNNTDGGYFALKGFAFQIDKSILEIFKSEENKPISIEEIEDINTDDFVIQVKYREKAKFTPSTIKEPIIQLLEEFKKDRNKKYYLYAYFNNLNGYSSFCDANKQISIDSLNTVLGVKKDDFDDNEKSSFIDNFYLDFSKDFQGQFDEVLQNLKQEMGENISDDEAIYYYSIIYCFLQKLVVNNPLKEDRKCTKTELLDYVESNKDKIFTYSFKSYKGESEYFKFVENKLSSTNKTQENIIFFGENIQIDATCTLTKLISDILYFHYKKATYDIKPLTFVISDNAIDGVKKELINKEIVFNDGYEKIYFNSKLFFRDPIINRKTKGKSSSDSLESISFKLRIISHSTFTKISDYSLSPEMIYYFNVDEVNIFKNISALKIDGLNTLHIKKIFNKIFNS